MKRVTDAIKRKLAWLSPAGNVTGLEDAPARDGRTPMVDRFAGVLSVLYEDAERGVFLLNRGGLTPVSHVGCVLELAAPTAFDAAGAQTLERLLKMELPAGAVVAVSLYASPLVRDELTRWVEGHAKTEAGLAPSVRDVLTRMAVNRAVTFDRAALTGRLGDMAYPVRRYRAWLSVTAPLTDSWTGEATDAALERFVTATNAMATLLTQFGLLRRRWRAADYVATLRELVNPQATRRGVLDRAAWSGRALRDAVVAPDTQIDVGKAAMAFTHVLPEAGDAGVEAVALAVNRYPGRTHVNAMAGLMGAARLTGAVLTYPYVVTCLIEPTPVADDRASVAVKCARVKQLKHTEIGVFLTDLAAREADLLVAQEACESGAGLARIAHELVVFAPKGKATGAAEMAKSVLSEAGFEGRVDAGLQLMGLMSVLPMEGAQGLMKDMKTARRTATVTRRAAAHLMPCVGDAESSPPRAGETVAKPMLLLTTRRGQLVSFDLFANRNGNYNAIVAGTSGSGKSVLAQEMVMSQLATGGRVWVFDVGESYRHCAQLAQGQWIDFEDTGLCINPLDWAGDATERIDEIAQIVTVMANGDVPLELTQSELLKRTLLDVMRDARAAGRVPTMTDVTLALTRPDNPGLEDVAVRLMPYAAGGRYAKWFEGPSTVDFASPMVVLEMQALMQKPVLQSVALLTLILRIFEAIRLMPRDGKKLIVIDEAWRLLSGNTGRFIEWACRTLRKYGAGILCISQSVEDFDASTAARAMKMNADTVFLLRQKAGGIRAYTQEPGLVRLLESLTTQAERFSEVYVKSGDAPGMVARLALDAFSMTAYSTRADVFEAVKAEQARGLAPAEAIDAVAKRMGR